jgi:Domain of unknown function (DUF3854)/Family of unknown function (DUF5906)
MLVDLHRSGLDEQDVTTLQLEYCDTAPPGVKPAARGYKLPYFNVDGSLSGFYRYRFLDDTRSGFEKLSGVKQRRYTQPEDTTPEVYLPPYTNWVDYLSDPEGALIITEGEKKAARVSKAGFPTLGLGGVWSFQNAAKNDALLPTLGLVNWADRTVFIIYDSDAADKLQIQQAEHRLARRLVTEGANVYVVRLPPADDGGKVGLDDYVQAHGIEALQDLCESVEPFVDSAALHAMNNDVAYVKNPGIVYVLKTGQLVSPADFKGHRFSDRRYTRVIVGKEGTRMEDRSTAEDWLKWPHRTAVEKLEFEPGEPAITRKGAINLWKGWPHSPRPGNMKPWHQLLDHIFAGAPGNRAWFEKWCAYPVQHPGAKQRNAVAIWGRGTGTGKSAIGYALGGLYGDYFAEIGDKQIENNDFNSWARNIQFVLADDITGNNSRSLANSLKTMISREKLEINLKHIQAYFTRDCINYYFTSNSPDAFLLDENDRRFFIHEVLGKPLDDDFYVEFAKWRESDAGKRALMHYLMNEVDCTGYNPTARPPMTSAKADMISLTRTDLEGWLIGVRDDPDHFCKKFGNSDLVTISELMTAYDPNSVHRVTPITMARKLKEVGVPRADPVDRDPGAQVRVAPNNELVRLYVLRNKTKWLNATSVQLKTGYEGPRKLVMREARAAKF